MAQNITLRSADALSLWAEDEGLFDDTILLAVDAGARKLTFGFCVPDQPPIGERFMPFTLAGDRTAGIAMKAVPALPAPMTCLRAEEGAAFGLDVTVRHIVIHAVGLSWRVRCGSEIDLPRPSPVPRTGTRSAGRVRPIRGNRAR